MYIEIENTFEKILFWFMWFGTDTIILFFTIVFLINCIQEHKKNKREKDKKDDK
jgi:hypothetical protein